MIEYPGGEFSANMSFAQAMEKLNINVEQGVEVTAVHFGTPAELDKRRYAGDLVSRLETLEMKFESREPPPESAVLYIPTAAEMKAVILRGSSRTVEIC